MAELNHKAKSRAIERAVAKSQRIVDLGLSSNMSSEERDAKAYDLATAKALKSNDGTTLRDHLDGQSWYINDLCEFSALNETERFEKEYAKAFIDEASVDQGIDMISQVMAKANDKPAEATTDEVGQVANG